MGMKMVKSFIFLLTILGFNSFYRYTAEGYPFRASFEDSGHFDSVDQYDLPSQSEIDITSSSSLESWSFSLWQHKTSTESAAEFQEFKAMLKDKNMIHLMARPLQVYYLDTFENDENSTKAMENHICRATVSPKEIYHTLQIDDSSINLLFICSTGRCCGLDCCHLNITFIFAISCICLAISSFILYFIFRSLSDSKKLRKLLPFLRIGRHHRVIKRVNATRKTRMNSSFDMKPLKRSSDTTFEETPESPPTRKKSQSVKNPHRLPEILLTPPKGLVHVNSVPSKYRRPKVENIL